MLKSLYKYLIVDFRKHAIQVELLLIVCIVAIASVFITHLEWRRLFDSIYYTVITLAGVWYGDITPKTDIGKWIAIVLASVWMPLYLLITTIIAGKMVATMKKLQKKQPQLQIVKTKAIITYQRKILFLKIFKKWKYVWDLPWGTVLYGEKIEHALTRRVYQELWVEVVIDKIVWVWYRKDINETISHCLTYKTSFIWDAAMIKSLIPEHELIRISIQDIISMKIDIQNPSLTQLIKEVYTDL